MQNIAFPIKRCHFPKFQKYVFRKGFMDFLGFKSNLVYPNSQIGVPTGPENPEIMKIEVFVFSHKQIEKLLNQNEAE